MDNHNNELDDDALVGGAGAAGANNVDNDVDPVDGQDEARVRLDPQARRLFEQMANDYDQQIRDQQQAADDRLHHELAQQNNHHQAQMADLRRQLQDLANQQQAAAAAAAQQQAAAAAAAQQQAAAAAAAQQQQAAAAAQQQPPPVNPANPAGLPPLRFPRNPAPPLVRGGILRNRNPPAAAQNANQPGGGVPPPAVPPVGQANQNIAQGGLPQQPAAPGAVPAAGLVAGGAPVVHPVPLAGNIAAQVGLPPPVVAPVNDWGQNRAFVAAPNHLVATVPGQVGDLGAINLQIVRILRDIMANDPQRVAEFDNLAEYIRPIVAASDATRTRERVSTELQPLTVVPNNWGDNDRIANIRLYNVPNFSGTSSDTIDVVSWIDRVFSVGQAHNLSAAAVINLMIMAATGTAADYIRQMRDEHKTPYQVVQALELRYGDLCHPDEAHSRCNGLERKEKEKLADFIDRLRKMAKMAYRNEPDEAARLRQTETLIKSNIRRVLPTSIQRSLDERIRTLLSMGKPELTCREVEKESIEMERLRDERMAKGKKSVKNQPNPTPKKYVRQAQINMVAEDSDPFSSDDEEVTTDFSEEEVDEEANHWIFRMEQAKRYYANKGKKLTPQQLRTKVTQKFNQDRKRYPRRNFGHKAAAAAAQVQNWKGPPEKLESEKRKNILELLTLANVNRGECIQCGTPGHMLGKDDCALRNRPLTDRPCAKCGKGLHSADDCLRGFSSQFRGKAEPAAANVAHEEEEDDLNTE